MKFTHKNLHVFIAGLALALLLSYSSKAQFSKLIGLWTGEDSINIEIKDTVEQLNTIEKTTAKNKFYEWCFLKIKFDTLTFYTGKYNKSNFKIISLSDSILFLKPVGNTSKAFIKDVLIFHKSSRKSIRFQKIIFHSGPCFGNCSILHIEIDSNRNVLYNGYVEYDLMPLKKKGHKTGVNDKINNDLTGRFTSKLPEKEYNTLIYILSKSKLDQIESSSTEIDAPSFAFIIYYNGHKKKLYSPDPGITEMLLNFFYHIHEKAQLIRTKEEFKIED
jgi:hypothetical protein